MRRVGSNLAILLGVPLLLVLLFATPAAAQTGRITFGINPTIFRAGQPANAELSVSSVSTTPLTLFSGYTFMFFVDSSLGTVSSITTPIAVESSSLLPGDFSASFAGGQNPIIITYNGSPKTFAFGDSLNVKVSLIASAQPGPGKLSLSSQFVSSVNGNLPFMTVSVVDFANSGTVAVAHDQSLTGDGTGAMPLGIAPGGVTAADLAAESVTNAALATGAVTASKIAPGQVVKSLNGLTDNVGLAAGANVTLTPSGNTLTIAAPNSLTAVAHDSTLTGNGTSGSPLGVIAGNSSAAFFSSEDITGGGVFLDSPGLDVVSKTVPAGSYVIFARVGMSNADSDHQDVVCTLNTGGLARITLPGSFSGVVNVTVQGVATLNSQTTITLHCTGFKVSTCCRVDGIGQQVALTAVKVAFVD
jgi:hypothetical protein